MHHVPSSSVGPLAGVRVLELGNFIAGPFAGQLLGDYGADVIKIEAPDGGDPMRHWGTTHDGDGLWWPTIARNKRSVVADLRTEAGRALVRSIAQSCDVIIENFRPGRLTDFGLDYEAVSHTNPGVIVVHVSGFGQTGPRAQEAGFGSIGEAVGGIRHTTGDPDRPPARAGVSLGDSLAALFAVIGTLAALREREQSGKGQEVDVAIYEAVAAIMESTMADFEIGSVVRGRSGGSLPGVAPAGAYPTADGSDVLIAGNADSVFARLCVAMGRDDLATDARFATHAARGENAAELDDLISAWTRTFAAEALLRLLAGNAVPAGRVYSAPDMVQDPHYLARDMVLRATSRAGIDLPMTGIVPRFSRTPGAVRDVGPDLGEHTDEVIGELREHGQAAHGAARRSTRSVRSMRIGLPGFGTSADQIIRQAERAEADGFASLWYASAVFGDPLVAIALAGRATARIELGTSVLQTYTCHPLLQANRAASVAAAIGTPGRFTCGVGPSHQPRIEAGLGLSYANAGRHTDEYVQILTALLNGEAVRFAGEDFRVTAEPIARPEGIEVPVLVGALGPRLLRVAAQHATGTITWMANATAIERHVAPIMSKAASDAGRDAPRIVAGLPVAVHDDIAVARHTAGEQFANYGTLPNYQRILAHGGIASPAEAAIVGNESDVAEQLGALVTAGATDVWAAPFAVGEDPAGSRARTRALLKELAVSA